jgi:hypothetical protein
MKNFHIQDMVSGLWTIFQSENSWKNRLVGHITVYTVQHQHDISKNFRITTSCVLYNCCATIVQLEKKKTF